MKIFISWSKDKSKAVALALKEWIPDILQNIEPWVSVSDINAGDRWNNQINSNLSEINFGIICLTVENTPSPWIHFEAGALAKTLNNSFVCPYLIDLAPTEIPAGPLTQFQAKTADRDGTLDLLRSINSASGDEGLKDERLVRIFDRDWPELEAKINIIKQANPPVQQKRATDDKIDEVLAVVRQMHNRLNSLPITSTLADQLFNRQKTKLDANRNDYIVRFGPDATEENVGNFQRFLERSNPNILISKPLLSSYIYPSLQVKYKPGATLHPQETSLFDQIRDAVRALNLTVEILLYSETKEKEIETP